MDPNKEFVKKAHPYDSPRPPKEFIMMVRCDATNCGHKTLISRDTWDSGEDIECSNCGETSYWSPL